MPDMAKSNNFKPLKHEFNIKEEQMTEEIVYRPERKSIARFGLPYEFRWPLIWVLFFAAIGIAIQSIQAKSLVLLNFFWSNYADWFIAFGSFTNVVLYPEPIDVLYAILSHWYYFFYTGGLISLIWAVISKIINFELEVTKKVRDVDAEEAMRIEKENELNVKKTEFQMMTEQQKYEREQEIRKKIDLLILKGENYVKLGNKQGARETYEAVKPLYDPKLDSDKRLFERILRFYNSIAK